MKVKVRNMTNRRGNTVPNQFIIQVDNTDYFQSYRTIIAKRNVDGITLDKDAWDYSRTTGKYRNIFLGETIADTRKNIKAGIYTLEDLND